MRILISVGNSRIREITSFFAHVYTVICTPGLVVRLTTNAWNVPSRAEMSLTILSDILYEMANSSLDLKEAFADGWIVKDT